jgi:SAM-dependent methyltransferase
LPPARERVSDPRVDLRNRRCPKRSPSENGAFEAVVLGLVLNFVPKADVAAAEIARVLKPGGVAAAYLWD